MDQENPGIFKRIYNVIRQITVEPVVFVLMTSTLLAYTASQTLALEKACRVNLNLSETICDALRNQNASEDNAANEKTVQEYVAVLMAYSSIITSVLPCLLLIFTGGWMDVTGRRKIIMLLAMTGEIFVQVNNIMNVVFFYQLRVEYLILMEAFLSSMFGGWSLLFLAVYSFIIDKTTEENRTWRVGFISFAITVGMPVGVSLSGILLKRFGYLTVYIITLSMVCFSACYVIFLISDPKRTKEQRAHDNYGFAKKLKTFFNPAHLLNSLRVIFKKTSDSRALRLCIMLATLCFVFGPTYGERATMYMFTRYRFSWDELQYSVFQAFNMSVNIVGTMFCVLVISKKFGCHDSILGIMSASTKIMSSFFYAFATTGIVFYAGSLVDIFSGVATMALRSIFSKTVEPHEIGKVNSIIGITEVLMPLLYVPVYTKLYTATMQVMPGFVFLLAAFLMIPPLLVFMWLLYRHIRAIKLEKQENSPPVQLLS